jgi:hypothetical protein
MLLVRKFLYHFKAGQRAAWRPPSAGECDRRGWVAVQVFCCIEGNPESAAGI